MSLCACQTQQSSDNFAIEGEAEGFADGDTLYLAETRGADLPFGMAVVENGRFNISGLTETSQMCVLYSPRQANIQIPLFVEPGKIQLQLLPDGATHISGTENNERLQAYSDSLAYYEEQMDNSRNILYGHIPPTRSAHIEAERQAQEDAERLNDYLARSIERNIANDLGCYILLNYGLSLPAEQRLQMIHRLPAQLQQLPEMVELEQALTAADTHETETAFPTQLASTTLSLTDGGTTTLPAEVEKYQVCLVQFWASWNVPYFRELPALKRLYRQYGDQGLGMIGVSLDQNEKTWRTAIEKNGLSWLQLSDLKGWDSELAETYRLDALPYYIVADRSGKILASGGSIEDLSDVIRTALQ